MDDEKIVVSIQYGFSEEGLFATITDLHRYEIDTSVQKYTELCENAIARTYPDAEITLHSADMETLVTVWDHLGEEIPDSDETANVEQVCQDVYKQFRWTVPKNLVLVSQARDYGIKEPTNIIRWACANGLIDGANKRNGYWEVPLEKLQTLNKSIEIVDGKRILELSQDENLVAARYCYWEDVHDLVVEKIPESVQILIVSENENLNSWFKPDNSLFGVTRVNNQFVVQVEHFIDIKRWAGSDWAYKTFAETLVSLAQKRGMDCHHQISKRNGKEEIDGFTLLAHIKLTPTKTLHDFIPRIVKQISLVIEDTELTLKGGILWDKAYEENEDLFCNDVLLPLLKKMGGSFVRYVHGQSEFGKDILFLDDSNLLHEPMYYVVQAKRGNVSGRAKSLIDTILAQIEDTFAIPYTGEANKAEIYITVMIVAISGKFTSNAITKIRYKMPQHLRGSVYFWDQQKIISLINQCWKKEKTE